MVGECAALICGLMLLSLPWAWAKYLRVQRGLAVAYWVHMSSRWTHADGGLQRFPVPGLQACYPHPGHFSLVLP